MVVVEGRRQRECHPARIDPGDHDPGAPGLAGPLELQLAPLNAVRPWAPGYAGRQWRVPVPADGGTITSPPGDPAGGIAHRECVARPGTPGIGAGACGPGP